MNNKLFVAVSMVFMAVLAGIAGRLLQEPHPGNDINIATVSPQYSGTLPDSNVIPIEAGEDSPDKVATLSSDRVAGQGEITEAPALSRAPISPVVLNEPPQKSEGNDKAPEAPAAPAEKATPPQEQQPAPATPPGKPEQAQSSNNSAASQAPAQVAEAANSTTASAPEKTQAPARPAEAEKPAETAQASGAKPAEQAPTQSSSNSGGTDKANQPAPQTQAQAPAQTAATPAPSAQRTRPGTIVTRSSLPAKAGQNVVTQASMSMDGDNVILRLEANAPIQGKAFLLAGPDRAVLDINGKWNVEPPKVLSNRMVNALRLGSQDNATRLVFDMRVKPKSVSVKQVSNNIIELRIR